jgi:polysaccharide export outer membrane protein
MLIKSIVFRKFLLLTTIALSLNACTVVPGMNFNGYSAVDSTDKASVPTVTPITLQLVKQQALAMSSASAEEKDVNGLLGVGQPYTIGPADVLSIIVWDHPELVMPNLTYTVGTTGASLPSSVGMASQSLPGYAVGQDGFVQFPYIKLVKVIGLTENEAQKLITDRLKPFVSDPQVTVRVIGYRSKKAYIDGEVRSPGIKQITDVPMTLAGILSDANGVAPTGDASRIHLTRNGRDYLIDLPELLQHGVSPAAIPILDNDIVKVPLLAEHRVFVMGEVTRQSPVPFHSDGRLSLSDALGDAGGVSQSTADPGRIYVIRPSQPGNMPEVFHLDSNSPGAMALASNFQLRPDDLVYVDSPGVVRWNRVISQLLGSTTTAYYVQRTLQNN